MYKICQPRRLPLGRRLRDTAIKLAVISEQFSVPTAGLTTETCSLKTVYFDTKTLTLMAVRLRERANRLSTDPGAASTGGGRQRAGSEWRQAQPWWPNGGLCPRANLVHASRHARRHSGRLHDWLSCLLPHLVTRWQTLGLLLSPGHRGSYLRNSPDRFDRPGTEIF